MDGNSVISLDWRQWTPVGVKWRRRRHDWRPRQTASPGRLPDPARPSGSLSVVSCFLDPPLLLATFHWPARARFWK